ncbi:MAG: tetratricopeptide repeat protein [Candidatus Omnitrophica bacterium]|nr:tetratricopeptide repeat protein [Candidatus Omnitrophota bacterium]
MKGLYLSIVLIIALGIGVYANSLGGEFIWDDIVLVKESPSIESLSHIGHIFSNRTALDSGGKFYFYRPLQMFTYAIDYSLWQEDPRGYHLTNLILHILVAISIYWLVSILFKDSPLALFSALLFVAHPIHTEAVAYISGRADSLATLFMLLALIFYIKYCDLKNMRLFMAAILCYLLAVFSRENSLIFPLIILLYHYAFEKKAQKKLLLSLFGLSLAYIILRAGFFSFSAPHTECPNTLLQRLPGFFIALSRYIRLLFLPLDLHMEYGNDLFAWNDPRAWLGLAMLLFLAIVAFRQRKRNMVIFLSIAWFFILLLPMSNLYPINAYMAEHWLYSPSIGFFLIVAFYLSSMYKVERLRKFSIFALAAILLYSSFLTVKQNSYWKEPVSLYKRTLKYAPQSFLVYNNLGIIYGSRSDFAQAVALFKKALAINPEDASAYNNLGKAYKAMHKNKEAIESYQKALAINPRFARVYYNLGNAYKDINKNNQAIDAYKEAIEADPYYAKAYYNLGITYSELGEYEKAAQAFERTIEITPDYSYAYGNLGNAYNVIGRKKEALESLKKAISLEPNNAYAYNNLAVFYLEQKNYKLAIQCADRAKDLGLGNQQLLDVLKPYRK